MDIFKLLNYRAKLLILKNCMLVINEIEYIYINKEGITKYAHDK